MEYLVTENTVAHRTDEYEITQTGQERPPQLVIRRGQPFEVELKLDRKFNPELDLINIIMEIGNYFDVQESFWLLTVPTELPS